MRQRVVWTALALAALLTVASCGLLWRHTDEVAPGVLRTPLPFACSLMHYTPASAQPFRTITLDCPGVDSIRLWPLPLVWPWYEDWFEQFGEIAVNTSHGWDEHMPRNCHQNGTNLASIRRKLQVLWDEVGANRPV
jgi:hypothetical protein